MFSEIAKHNRAGWNRIARLICLAFTLMANTVTATQNVSLAWDASPDPDVVGYFIYYGGAACDFTNRISVGNLTSATISNLVERRTYFFAATARNTSGLESDFSNEVSYTVPAAPLINQPPTMDSIADACFPEDARGCTISLTGISPGNTNESQTLVITATSSNPALLPAPTIVYTSPQSTGKLLLAPARDASGVATVTVTVDDGQPVNNKATQSFSVTVLPVNDRPYLAEIPNLTLAQGATPQTLTLLNIHSGAANEPQSLTIKAVSSNPALIPAPVVTYTSPSRMAILRLAPAPAKSGSAEIIVTLEDGQSENGLFCRSFRVEVAASNSPPVISPIAYQTTFPGRLLPPIPFAVYDRETIVSELELSVTSDNPAVLSASALAIGGSGTDRYLTVASAPKSVGRATITVLVSDGALSTSSSFTVVVSRPVESSENAAAGNPVDQPFSAASLSSGKHTFAGLFFETNKIRQHSSGYLTLSTSRKGKYSGYAQLGSKRHSFLGALDAESRGTNSLKRGEFGLSFQLLADGRLAGQVTSGDWVAQLEGSVTRSGSERQTAKAMTLVLPGGGDGTSAPAGHGYATLQFKPTGRVTILSQLADGTRSVSSLWMPKDQILAWYAPLYSGTGSLMSWLQITNNEIGGLVNWIKPDATKTRLYSGGFESQSQATGSVFLKTNSAAGLLQATTARLTFNGQGVALTNQVSLASQVKNVGPGKMSVSLNRNNGVFSGTVMIPGQSKPGRFRGIILQDQLMGFGYLPIDDHTVPVTFEPLP